MSLLPGGDPRYDVSRTGLPSWAKRDTGPLNTYVPGPMSSEPLENSYNTSMRLWISGLIFAGVIVFVVVNSRVGVVGTVLGLVGLWALYAVPTWLRGRTGLRVDGPRCAVHGWFREVSFAGEDVAKVQHVFAGRSPDIRLVLRDGRRVMVVASRIEKGHSTLFEWLRRYAPDAEYDAKSIDVRDMLVTRGLMGAPGDAWDLYGLARVPQEPRDPITTTQVPEEHRDEVAARLEEPPTSNPLAAAGTSLEDVPSDVESPPAESQARPESEDS
jgi:hypothetical protein